MSGPSFDRRVFRSTAAETGAGSSYPVGYYHQDGDLVWAEFSGGAVRVGRLVGHRSPEGTLSAGYVQLLAGDRLVSGTVVTTASRLPDGRLRLREEWQRGDGSTGVSYLDEITAPDRSL
ncbi:hypothetical protein GCM10022222_83740 [Amycolatopsis ultiminotia]|uniref:Uncharacterized protein n=1 Tax=Amycolatopsis ultiminotia TaxID=543629 RepID=A0ABP6YML0_9PSEU